MGKVSDIRIIDSTELPSPKALREEIGGTEAQVKQVADSREHIRKILNGEDSRFLVILGPCSIHDVKAGKEYAEKLAALAKELDDRIFVVMRVYFEKPRTSVGWKGLIMDPHLNDTCDIPAGLKGAREFLCDVLDIELPTATEFLDPITPQYIADLISWASLGARTSESQTHRQMASGLSMPLGIKNATSGNLDAATNAILAAKHEQTFLGITEAGLASAVTTAGNPDCHVVLRGGSDGPNYSAESIKKTQDACEKKQINSAVVVDCSHANSGKDPAQQPSVLKDVIEQRKGGNSKIVGAMLESNLQHGNQSFPAPIEELAYGVSITDGCLGWDDTEKLLREIYSKLG